jgi:hypothetical protein
MLLLMALLRRPFTLCEVDATSHSSAKSIQRLMTRFMHHRSLAGAAVIAVTCLACSSGDYQSGDFVFATYINETGWNNGVAWILGLLQSSFGLTGYDAVSHVRSLVGAVLRQTPNLCSMGLARQSLS